MNRLYNLNSFISFFFFYKSSKMSLQTGNCFYCSNVPQKTNSSMIDSTDDQETLTSYSDHDNKSSDHANLYTIFHYLSVPKSLLDQCSPSAITICKECREISESLSKLCEELEVTKMKINYTLNLLTTQILSKSTSSSVDDNADDQSCLSSVQEIFRVNCMKAIKYLFNIYN